MTRPKTVHIVRSVLGAEAILSFGDEELVIGPAASSCDAVEFATAIEAGLLGRALELYRGDLMPGFHRGTRGPASVPVSR